MKRIYIFPIMLVCFQYISSYGMDNNLRQSALTRSVISAIQHTCFAAIPACFLGSKLLYNENNYKGSFILGAAGAGGLALLASITAYDRRSRKISYRPTVDTPIDHE